MVLEEIDAKLALLKKAHQTPLEIRLGEQVVPQFILEMAGTGETITMDGSPIHYQGIPVTVGAIDPTAVNVESEAAP
jgi:hypothetical protein